MGRCCGDDCVRVDGDWVELGVDCVCDDVVTGWVVDEMEIDGNGPGADGGTGST